MGYPLPQQTALKGPFALDPITLGTKGFVDRSPSLPTGIHATVAYGDNAFTAHPKWDHETGVLYGWTYRDTAPYVTLHIVHPEYLIFDTDNTMQGPICTIELPFALGSTPHGHWMDFR